MHNRDCNRYCRNVKKAIPLHSERKKKYMEVLRAEVTNFLETHPNAGYDALIANFGAPDTQAEVFFDAFSPAEIRLLCQRSKIVLGITLATAVLFLFGAGITFTKIVHDNAIATNGYYIQTYDDAIILEDETVMQP